MINGMSICFVIFFTNCWCLFQNCSLGIVGEDMNFTIFDDEAVTGYVSLYRSHIHIVMCNSLTDESSVCHAWCVQCIKGHSLLSDFTSQPLGGFKMFKP